MPLFKRRNESGAGAGAGRTLPALPDVSHLTDHEWWALGSRRYEEHWKEHVGSPETFAECARNCYGQQDFSTAACFFRKAIDLLHTQYLFGAMERRRPSPADAWIVDGYVSAIGASRQLHPQADVAESVREVTHRLRTISTACQRVGLPDQLYRGALNDLVNVAPDIDVSDVLW